jgi:acetylornithine deacetylase
VNPRAEGLARLAGDLIAIDSTNPALVPGAPGERAIADFAANWLCRRGVEVREISTPGVPDRPSLLCRVAGSGGGPSLALYAHLDTVGVAGMRDPFTPVVRDGALHGRGAWDMKGSLAAIMRVAATVAAAPCAGDLWLMLVADEEHASAGAEAVLGPLAQEPRLAGAIVAEPSGLEVMVGHRGFATGTIVTRGRAAHTARRDEGIDAVAMMARVIVAIEDLDAALHAGAAHPLLGHEAVVVSMVRGGSELFTYPAECEAHFVWRTLPGRARLSAAAALEEIFRELAERDARFDGSVEWGLWRDPLLTDMEQVLVRSLAHVAEQRLGARPAFSAAPWWTDAALIQQAGIPAVIFGPPGGGIHAANEWVDLAGLEQFEGILLEVTRTICR